MEKRITLYTRKERVVEEVRRVLSGTDISVVVDPTFMGAFQDPSFVDHRGNRFVGYQPLYSYIDRVAQGETDPEIANPLGEVFDALLARLQRSKVFENYSLFGSFFSEESNTRH